MSGDFTRLGFLFFEWQPVRYLDPTALKVWLVLYTKSIIPGLWRGDLPDLASQSFLSMEDTLKALDKLLDGELIEFDREHRVLRLTQLPDAGEWPAAPSIIHSWWSNFNKKVPRCAVRDAHVATMRWLLEEGARHSPKNKSGRPSPLHEQIWSETFGTISVPSTRRRGVRSFGEADLGTPVQPSLFGSPSPTPVVPLMVESRVHDSGPSKDPDPKEINNSDSQSSGTGEGEGAGEGVFFSSPEEGGGSKGEGGAGGKPHLMLVPMPPVTTGNEVLMFDVTTLTQTLRDGFGRPDGFRLTAGQENAMAELVTTLAATGIGDADLPILAEWIKNGGMRKTGIEHGVYSLVTWWLEADHLAKSVRTARAWHAEVEERRRDLAQARERAGV